MRFAQRWIPVLILSMLFVFGGSTRASAAKAQDSVILWVVTDSGDIWFADGSVVANPCDGAWKLVYYWQSVRPIPPDCWEVKL